MKLQEEYIKEGIEAYVKKIDNRWEMVPDGVLVPDALNMINDLIIANSAHISLEDLTEETKEQLRKNVAKMLIARPTEYLVALLLFNKYHWILMDFVGEGLPNTDVLALYLDKEGIYTTNKILINKKIADVWEAGKSNFVEEVIAHLKKFAPVKALNKNKDLIPLKNGILDYKTKKLLDFDPQYVFNGKANVNLNLNIEEPNIDGWTPSEWIKDLSDEPDFEDLIYKIIGAALRPYVSWNQAALFYNTTGMNGKGTIAELIRGIVGHSNVANIPIAKFSESFALTELLVKNLIITDENEVNGYIEDATSFKNAVTGDVLKIDVKYKDPISLKFKGYMIHCVNALPKTKDKTESTTRRFLLVPFSKTFKGRERKEIKDDYIKRQEVKEWFVKKVLIDMEDFYEINPPQFSLDLLEDFSEKNDNVIDFLKNGLIESNTYQFLTSQDLYILYKNWTEENGGGTGRAIVKKKDFLEGADNYFEKNNEYVKIDRQYLTLSSAGYNRTNPLLLECNFKNNKGLENLSIIAGNKNLNYKGSDLSKLYNMDTKIRKAGYATKQYAEQNGWI